MTPRPWGRVAVAAVAAAGLWWLGRTAAAIVVAGLALASVMVPPFGRFLDRALFRLAAGATRVVSLVLIGVVELVVVVPAWAAGRVLRAGRWRRSQPETASAFLAAGTGPAVTTAGFSATGETAPSRSRPRSLVQALANACGVVVLVLVANFALGWTWDWLAGNDTSLSAGPSSGAPVANPIRVVQKVEDLRDVETTPDPRADLPTMADQPWWPDYLREIQLTGSTYYPYLIYRPLDFDGRYVHITDWARRSYQPEPVAPGAEMPEVWFLGGSAMWGEGQRDEHTIPSEVARLAEADGLPIRPVNFGQRGWTNWQEMLLYEQRLATAPNPPAASVFYDGTNDKNVQTQLPLGEPSHYDVENLSRTVSGRSLGQGGARASAPELDNGSAAATLWRAYRRHSFADKATGKGRDLWRWAFGSPASAAEAQDPEACYVADDGTETCTDESVVIENTLTVYRRGRELIQELSGRYDSPVLFFWQPERGPSVTLERIAERLDRPTIDLTDVLDDHQAVYIDGGHTNEEGARLVAETQWRYLKPVIEEWYRTNKPAG